MTPSRYRSDHMIMCFQALTYANDSKSGTNREVTVLQDYAVMLTQPVFTNPTMDSGKVASENRIRVLRLNLASGDVVYAFPDPEDQETGHDNEDRRTDFG